MRIIVFGANGRQGSRLVSEALERGHEVTAAVRSEAANVDPRAEVVVADALDADRVAEVSAGHDVALNATRDATPTSPGRCWTALRGPVWSA
jgi:putative NADH-flavin reductase